MDERVREPRFDRPFAKWTEEWSIGWQKRKDPALARKAGGGTRKVTLTGRPFVPGRALGRPRLREPRACVGELHLDGSRQRWLALLPERWLTHIAVVDDATQRVRYVELREGGEGVAAIMERFGARVFVKTGLDHGSDIEVAGALPAGTQVAVEGAYELQDGMAVKARGK